MNAPQGKLHGNNDYQTITMIMRVDLDGCLGTIAYKKIGIH